jgi:endonuclease/exonuclease/phosphatase family metal-dependent hydrolase
MRSFKKVIKLILVFIALLIIGFLGLIGYATISDYRPEEKTEIYRSNKPVRLTDTAEITLISWNIGYCGLDKDMDFFYDGGKKVITPRNRFFENLEAVKDFFRKNDSIDFFLVQEIDKRSKRSYYVDQFVELEKLLEDYSAFFAINYKVFFVPLPPSSPMGKVLSGIATFSKYRPLSSVRYQFPGEYAFPKQLFLLDRCFLVNRYPLENGKELLVINTHNEAFDPGDIRKAQMAYLREFLESEFKKGNYIITGGDWNQTPPGFKPDFSINKINTEQMMMNSGYLPDEWGWLYDSKTPTNRSVVAAYDPATTTTTVIDHFLISPNIKSVFMDCINLGFESSDHNPVRIKIILQK